MKDKKGLLFVLSGPSGAGKSTVIREVLRRNPALYFSISCTTRPPRQQEKDGFHYFFIDHNQFKAMIARDEFLEYAEYVGNYYGTPLPQIKSKLDAGIDVLLDIEIQGAIHVREKMPESVSIFLAPPSFQELERRLRSRNTDKEEKILSRLKTARAEFQKMPLYDYVVINHKVEDAVSEIESILKAEHCRTAHRMQLIEEE
ncbi:MAG: guanylate kinase [Oscillospiraceae bacterium]|jgi:guanylate kinase|nr:guanylate kinase [Oscillospiraceae bacterium]